MTSRQSDFDVMKNTKVPVEKWELFKLAIGRLCCVDFVGRVGSFALSEQDSATASGARLLRLEDVALVDPPASKEAVAYHLLAEQKNERDQDNE
jgi:hypothetical protein